MPIRTDGADRSYAAIADVWKREIGKISSINFSRRRAASQDLVRRLDIIRKLDNHHGCVNTISFNEAGDILVSGADDRRVILWDWECGKVRFSFHSGHQNNVFQAKFTPYCQDRSIVTCAADGQVRHAHVCEGSVHTKLLAKHLGRVHKVASEPGNPHSVYTCGEDALVQHIDLRTEKATSMFTCASRQCSSYFRVALNAIAINPRNPNFFAVGGGDQFARLFDIRRCIWHGSTHFGQPADHFCPPRLVNDEKIGITGLAFSDQSELLVSYSEEFIYLFTKNTGLGPQPTVTSHFLDVITDAFDVAIDYRASSLNAHAVLGNGILRYNGHQNRDTVKGVNFFGPRCEYVVSGSDCGRIFIWNKKCGDLIRVMEADQHIVNCVEGHPHATVLASSGIENDIKIWTTKATIRAAFPTTLESSRASVSGTDDEEDNDHWNIDDDEDEEEESDDGNNDHDNDNFRLYESSDDDNVYDENATIGDDDSSSDNDSDECYDDYNVYDENANVADDGEDYDHWNIDEDEEEESDDGSNDHDNDNYHLYESSDDDNAYDENASDDDSSSDNDSDESSDDDSAADENEILDIIMNDAVTSDSDDVQLYYE